MTFQELNHYFAQNHLAVKNVLPAEINLEIIKQLFKGFLGVEDKKKSEPVDNKIVPQISFTTEEKQAWIEAGMPQIDKFLKQHRRKKK